MRISIIGAGYVGLVAAVCLSELGNDITLVDINEDRLKRISSGISPIHEEGLADLLKKVDIKTTTDYEDVPGSQLVLICVGTPSDHDGSMCTQFIEDATERVSDILNLMNDYCVVVVKSTVVPGTTEEILLPILERSGRKVGRDFGLCMEPEFLREGTAIHYYMNPARIVIGEHDRKSGDLLASLYQGFNAPIMRTNIRTAEMLKLASNAFLGVKISFINEIGNICKLLGVDTYEVARGMGYDDRIGSKFLNAGVGFGGSCIPKDTNALISKSRQLGYDPRILHEALGVNDRQSGRMVELLKRHVPLSGSTIGVLGLAFKAGTDDVRESRAVKIVQLLLEEGARVRAYDPYAVGNFRKLFPRLDYPTPQEVLDCDAVVIVTEWEEFERFDYAGRIVIDGRGIRKAREAQIYEGLCW